MEVDECATHYETEATAYKPMRRRTLMRKMGIKTVYRKPRLSKSHPDHEKYPYLLRGLEIKQPNQVWATDITYIPTDRSNCYQMAIIDWASRLMLSWRLSNTMDTTFCMDALHEAIDRYGTPEIFNSDQGSQFTSEEFTNSFISNGIKISMDGKGRWVDNVIIEQVRKVSNIKKPTLRLMKPWLKLGRLSTPTSSITIVSDVIRALTEEHLMKFTGVSYPNRGQRHEQAAST